MSNLSIGTWNVNSLRVRLPQLVEFLAKDPLDALVLQEIKLEDKDFPEAALTALGYHCVWHGQKTYNGVALIARSEPREVVRGIPGYTDAQARVIAATIGGVRIVGVYVPNGQALDSDKYGYKLDWLGQLERYMEELRRSYPHVVVLGDYNIAPDDRDVHDPAAWAGQVLVSAPERAALARLTGHGYVDVFRQLTEDAGHYSWWDYRAAGFRRNHGLRIDLILASTELAGRCRSCRIDREPRGWERPSDHAPVVAAFEVP